jgi:uncharacterized protein (TIGR02001 family)
MNLTTKSALAVLTLLAANAAFSQGKAPEPDYTLGYNAGVVTDYRYRGITQTRFEPTLQAGADYAHKSGFYVGAWASGIKWIKDAGASAGDIELDLYAGYKGAINADLSYDIGFLRYEYVGNTLQDITSVNANTNEVYAALTYGPVTVKYSYALSTLFGFPDSRGSGYLDASASFDLGNGYSLAPHLGNQTVAKFADASYTDYSLTVTKDLGKGLSVSLAAVGTNAKDTVYVTPKGDFAGRSGAVLGLKYSF